MRLKSDPVSTSPGISGDHSYRVIPWPLVSTVLVVGVKPVHVTVETLPGIIDSLKMACEGDK